MPGPAPPPRRVDGDALLAGDAAARDALASSVRTRGFAVLRLAAPTAAPFVAGVGAARAFFRLPPQQKEATRQLYGCGEVLCQTNLNALGELEMCYDVYISGQSPFFSVTQSCNSQNSCRSRK